MIILASIVYSYKLLDVRTCCVHFRRTYTYTYIYICNKNIYTYIYIYIYIYILISFNVKLMKEFISFILYTYLLFVAKLLQQKR